MNNSLTISHVVKLGNEGREMTIFDQSVGISHCMYFDAKKNLHTIEIPTELLGVVEKGLPNLMTFEMGKKVYLRSNLDIELWCAGLKDHKVACYWWNDDHILQQKDFDSRVLTPGPEPTPYIGFAFSRRRN
ncbi:hypothetical protein [Xanthocytophaga agilis]|uniref:Uncharacterized protein n=1 Tax=Xanthocytophaga agilis TaxID=3048010 RepID=A0AAE3RCP3_9BACT|nr:hypothetical protein [Xanthocytophaga agilis]MDJ1505208.1 hypothetical protein [Xanthocytophaga agilis]